MSINTDDVVEHLKRKTDDDLHTLMMSTFNEIKQAYRLIELIGNEQRRRQEKKHD